MLRLTDKGIRWAVFTALISGVSVFLNKFAVAAITPPLVFTSIKNLAVGLLVFSIVIATKKLTQIKKLTFRELKYLLTIGVVGGSLPFYLFFTGLSQIPAINAAIIHKTLFVWVALLAIPLLGERLNKRQMLAAVFILAGNFVIGGFGGFKYSVGELMVLGATVLWAIENILAKKILAKTDPDIISLFRMGAGSLILIAASVATASKSGWGSISLSPQQTFWFSVTVLLLLGYVLSWYRALKYSPAATVTAVLTLSTLITNLLSAIFISHSWNYLLTLQATFLLAGTVLFVHTSVKNNSKPKLQPSQTF